MELPFRHRWRQSMHGPAGSGLRGREHRNRKGGRFQRLDGWGHTSSAGPNRIRFYGSANLCRISANATGSPGEIPVTSWLSRPLCLRNTREGGGRAKICSPDPGTDAPVSTVRFNLPKTESMIICGDPEKIEIHNGKEKSLSLNVVLRSAGYPIENSTLEIDEIKAGQYPWQTWTPAKES